MNCSIRGAITADSNTREDILLNTRQLLKEMIELNEVKIEDIVSILFTATKDLDAAYPAVAARELGIVDASLMCAQEMYVKGSLEMCLRVQMDIHTEKKQSDYREPCVPSHRPHSCLQSGLSLRTSFLREC